MPQSIYQETAERVSLNNTIVLEQSLLENTNGGQESEQKENKTNDVFANRKPISEVLYDIYDRK